MCRATRDGQLAHCSGVAADGYAAKITEGTILEARKRDPASSTSPWIVQFNGLEVPLPHSALVEVPPCPLT